MAKPNLSALDTLSDPFDETIDLPCEQDDLEGVVLRLSDYLSATELVIKQTFSHHVWVKAEIRNLSTKGGHYYFELAEKDDAGKIIASCRGTLWRYKASPLLAKFKRSTGMDLSRDLTVLIQVNANFHPQYGFSLNVHDIDPNYTLGDLARQYAAMLERLAGEGLLEQNKKHPAPFDIEHVLVIAPEKAAGLGDFQADANRLAATEACHFDYYHATFQGNHAPAEIRQAITTGMIQFKKTHNKLPDLMVIIRGGGAVGDLAYLNDYELAALVAEQPIPVWVGIGHERDRVILDEVAHTSFDTPSKVIAAISSHLLSLMQRTQTYCDQIKQMSIMQLSHSLQACDQAFYNIKSQSSHCLRLWQKDCDSSMQSITQQAQFQIKQAQQQTTALSLQLQKNAQHELVLARQHTQHSYAQIKYHSQQLINHTKKELAHYQQRILIQHPARLLQQGYAIIKDTQTQNIISNAKQLNTAQSITINMQDGQVMATVDCVQLKANTDTPDI
ncbi:exodeoxyribonuclease VII large subunit [Psychrobacter sp. I-STPA10]|uniref:exodeoxyribonuclease VII large subunit n=1 Tax=Psychrobacter sp. I-STPA10 TaxID=2585769 RepID=UPI001E2FFC21|nr:exodeoxyribonuclease VII large subunit [Psychrobacter sp. I-STPA10]